MTEEEANERWEWANTGGRVIAYKRDGLTDEAWRLAVDILNGVEEWQP